MDDADGEAGLFSFGGVEIGQDAGQFDFDVFMANGRGLGEKVRHHGIEEPDSPKDTFGLFSFKGCGAPGIAFGAMEIQGKAHANRHTKVEEGPSDPAQVEIVSNEQGALVDV
jgi:hypothetical protein